MEDDSEGPPTFAVDLSHVQDIPTRLTLATLVESHRFWIGYMIILPLLCLIVAVIDKTFVSFAASVPVGVTLLLYWFSRMFGQSTLTLNIQAQEVTISNPFGGGRTSVLKVDGVDSVSIVTVNDTAIIRFSHVRGLSMKPSQTPIRRSDISEVKTKFEQMGIAVQMHDLNTTPLSNPNKMRVVLTPIIIVASAATVWQVFGISAFATNGVAVPLLALLAYIIYDMYNYVVTKAA